ncbi:MAG: hypothetical protein AABZ39_18685 [Spirochaetota bacterium]|mgnify:FL=1
MAKFKCRKCGAENEKVNDRCVSCKEPLYHDTPYPTAVTATLILDVVFMVLYAVAIPLYMHAAQGQQSVGNSMAVPLPEAGSFFYMLWLLLFGIYIAVRLAYIVNHFTVKNETVIFIRRLVMFAESVTMFPVQSILALYFYNPATKKAPTKV